MSEVGSAVEPGPRKSPLLHALRPDFIKGKELVFIEKDFTYVEPLKVELQKAGVTGKVIHGDAQDIDLREEGVPLADTIFAKDLLGQAGGLNITKSGWNGEVVDINFSEIAENWNRNSNPGAKIIIAEIASPATKRDVVGAFEGSGFKLTEKYEGQDMQKIFNQENPNHTLQVMANASVKYGPPDSYVLVFTKK